MLYAGLATSRFSCSKTAEQSAVTVNSSVHTVTSVRASLLLCFAHSGKRPFRLGKGHEFQGPDHMKPLCWFDAPTSGLQMNPKIG
jgi:hypothetical protein